MLKDCKHRNGFKCIKLNKSIAVDMRDPVNPCCWEQSKTRFINGCRDYEEKTAR